MHESPLIYLNGHLLPANLARISPFDYSFMYGFSLFETLRSYNGKLFRLSEHLERLKRGAVVLGMQDIPDDTEIEKAIRQVLQGNNLKDARIRITFSAGEGSLSPDLSSCRQKVLLVSAAAFTPADTTIYEEGYKAIISGYRRDSRSPLSRIKSGNYLISMLSNIEAKQQAAQTAVLLNEIGSLSETGMANIFLVKNKTLITPHEESGILPGITRAEVLWIGKGLGFPVEEREVKPEELFKADEAFITSSLIEIMPLTQLDGQVLGKGLRGEITAMIHAAYRAVVIEESLPILLPGFSARGSK